ncbi:putative membrane-associated protein [Desulfosporosinus acidiphilus SJ4]|uniref:Putative membrane-associated protein n=1 Tax=Desulfosporosinus acidiphilus (strain DSM 22704 / JCM 16185 / SJ4) TaxID=646529 RepID=I4D4Z0_DESAJ|nr:DedA family protein [Desulfosporosinus acidiphilus]AFM40864.1 putative membrane-associated protein [Desulfosporosinus acidiphilus SJ4]
MSSTLLISYVTHYGYLGLYVILGISILGVPLPDETLMVFIGFLTYEGKLNPVLAVLSSAGGSITGITVAYFLGRLFQQNVMHHLKKHAGSERLEKAFEWYQRHGGKLLTIGYFIPGVRHLSGYIAGLTRLSYKSFAFFAYLGAILWVSIWVIIGRLLGSRWETILPIIHRYALILGVIAAFLALTFYLVYRYHHRLGDWLYNQWQRLPERYMSLGKRRLIVTVGGLLFLVLFIFFMGLIQDFVSYEVGPSDDLVVNWLAGSAPYYLVPLMQTVNALGTHLSIFIVFIAAGGLLWFTTKRLGHMVPLALAWLGGTVIDLLFRLIFSGYSIRLLENLTPIQASSQGFLIAALSFYAVLGYLIGKSRHKKTQFTVGILDSLLLIALTLSPIYLRIHPPSTMLMSLTVSGLLTLISLFIYEFRFSYYKKQLS